MKFLTVMFSSVDIYQFLFNWFSFLRSPLKNHWEIRNVGMQELSLASWNPLLKLLPSSDRDRTFEPQPKQYAVRPFRYFQNSNFLFHQPLRPFNLKFYGYVGEHRNMLYNIKNTYKMMIFIKFIQIKIHIKLINDNQLMIF